MSEKKYVVPDEMRRAVREVWLDAVRAPNPSTIVLEAAIRWLAENPIVPTVDSTVALMNDGALKAFGVVDMVRWSVIEWQRRMLLAPEPELPEGIMELCEGYGEKAKEIALAAYRLGQKAK